MFSLLGTTGFKAHKLQVEYDVSDIKQVIVIILKKYVKSN